MEVLANKRIASLVNDIETMQSRDVHRLAGRVHNGPAAELNVYEDVVAVVHPADVFHPGDPHGDVGDIVSAEQHEGNEGDRSNSLGALGVAKGGAQHHAVALADQNDEQRGCPRGEEAPPGVQAHPAHEVHDNHAAGGQRQVEREVAQQLGEVIGGQLVHSAGTLLAVRQHLPPSTQPPTYSVKICGLNDKLIAEEAQAIDGNAWQLLATVDLYGAYYIGREDVTGNIDDAL
eukprot:scaffold166484_cov39-Prasinocladus_malaysianus.AAC.1